MGTHATLLKTSQSENDPFILTLFLCINQSLIHASSRISGDPGQCGLLFPPNYFSQIVILTVLFQQLRRNYSYVPIQTKAPSIRPNTHGSKLWVPTWLHCRPLHSKATCLMSAINALPMVCIFITPVMAATPSAPMLQFSKQFPSFPISQSYISTSLIVLSHYSLLIPHVQCPFISLRPGTLQVSSNSHTICKLLQNGINKTLFQAFIYFKQ